MLDLPHSSLKGDKTRLVDDPAAYNNIYARSGPEIPLKPLWITNEYAHACTCTYTGKSHTSKAVCNKIIL